MNQTAKEILDANIDKYFAAVPPNERSDFARKLPVPAYEVTLKAMEEYAIQQVKQVTEERDKAVELLKSARELFDRPETDQYANSDLMHLMYNEITPFLNSLNAAKEGGE